MADSRRTVFLSGTRRDLGEHFLAAQIAIDQLVGYQAVLMEEGYAEGIPPDMWSRREASKPDVFVGLVGRYYGRVPKGSTKSITEQEYEAARAAGIESLMFLTESGDLIIDEDTEHVAALEAFRTRLGIECTYTEVTNPEDFARKAAEAVLAWERRTWGGATLAPREYFRPWLGEDALLSHTDILVGQTEGLEKLEAFRGSGGRVLVLHGPWGRGKSRLLWELARRETIGPLRFAREGVAFSRETLGISAVDPCVLIQEDAHKMGADELRSLLSLVSHFGPQVQIVLSTRTSHLDGILEQVRSQGFDPPVVYEVPPLTDLEQRQLIAAILGEDGSAAHILSSRTRGNPLAAVIAARLVHRGAITILDIEGNEQFHYAVINAFRQAVLDQAKLPREDCEELLRLLALAGPVRPDDEAGMAALAGFLGWTPERLKDGIRELEDAGFLLRRGGLVRIPVDAVAEAELLHACVNRQGESLGFAERALDELWPAFGRNVLPNLATANWDARQSGRKTDLLKSAWPRLRDMYAAGTASLRIRLLEALEDIAPLAPREVAEFVAQARGAPPPPQETAELTFGPIPVTRIHDRLSALLLGPLRQPDLVPAACDLLWEMARDDTRPPHQIPRSAERILGEVGEYHVHKPIPCQEALLGWVERRTGRPVPGYRMAKYLRPLLKREMMHDWSDGCTFYMRSYGVAAERVSSLRTRALDLLEGIAKSETLQDVAAATEAIGDALTTQLPSFGRQVTDAEEASWHPEELDALERLRRIRAHHRSDVVDLCVLSVISWVAEHSPHRELRDSAHALVTEIRTSLEGSLALALSPQYKVYPLAVDEVPEHAKAVATTAKRLTSSGEHAQDVLAKITDTVVQMDHANREPRPETLLHLIAEQNGAMGEAFVESLLAVPEHRLQSVLDAILSGILKIDPERGRRILETCLARASTRGLVVVAQAYRFPEWIPAVEREDASLQLRQLLRHPEEVVRRAALMAVGHAKALPDRARLDLLLKYDVASAPNTGDEWACAIAGPHLHTQCTEEECKTIAEHMKTVAELDYWCGVLIEHLSSMVPQDVVDLLLIRVRLAGTREGFEPVPDIPNRNPLSTLPMSERRRALYELGEALGSHDFRVAHAAARLASQLAVHGQDLREVQLAWANSGNPERVLQAASSLRERPAQTLFDEEELIVEIIRAADALGRETREDVHSILLGVSLNGVRSSAPGEPAPLDVQIRDQARTAAQRYAHGSPERILYEAISQRMEWSISQTLTRADEETIE